MLLFLERGKRCFFKSFNEILPVSKAHKKLYIVNTYSGFNRFMTEPLESTSQHVSQLPASAEDWKFLAYPTGQRLPKINSVPWSQVINLNF
jgi:hypothetical protein